jgi:hypothetical protein
MLAAKRRPKTKRNHFLTGWQIFSGKPDWSGQKAAV